MLAVLELLVVLPVRLVLLGLLVLPGSMGLVRFGLSVTARPVLVQKTPPKTAVAQSRAGQVEAKAEAKGQATGF